MKSGDLAILHKHVEVKSKTLLLDINFSEDKTVRILSVYNNTITFELTDVFNKAGEFECNKGVLSEYKPKTLIEFFTTPTTNFWYNFYKQSTNNK